MCSLLCHQALLEKSLAVYSSHHMFTHFEKLMRTSDSKHWLASVGLWLLCAVGLFPLRAVRNQCSAWGCSFLCVLVCPSKREIHSRLFTLCLHRHPHLSRTWYQSQEILSRFKKKRLSSVLSKWMCVQKLHFLLIFIRCGGTEPFVF